MSTFVRDEMQIAEDKIFEFAIMQVQKADNLTIC